MPSLRLLFSPESYNLGETTRGIEVATEARLRGHETRFHIYSRRYLQTIEDAGQPVRLAQPVMSDRDADQIMALDQGRGIRHPFTYDLVRHRVLGEIAALEESGADAVVIGSNPTMFLSARIAGVPLFYVRPYAFSNTHLSVGTAQGTGTAPRALRVLARVSTWKPRAFSRVAKEFGLELPRLTVDALSADVNLIASLFPALRGDSTADGDVSVGPIFSRPAVQLPALVQGRSSARPLVYVGMGSSGSSKILASVLQQLSSAPVDVLVAGGVGLSHDDRQSLGANIHLESTVPAHLLAGHVDASITHGGEGTVQAACLSGVPFAGIAMQAEQRWNIDECVRYGNALRFTETDVRKGRVRQILDELLTSKPLRDRARELEDQVRELDGPAHAVDAIEQHLETHAEAKNSSAR